MKITLISRTQTPPNLDLLVALVDSAALGALTAKGGRVANMLSQLNRDSSGAIAQRVKRADFKGEHGKTLSIDLPSNLGAYTVLLYGWDVKKTTSAIDTQQSWLRLGSVVAAEAARHKAARVGVCGEVVLGASESAVEALIEGCELGGYSFTRYKSKKSDAARYPQELCLFPGAKLDKGCIGRALNAARATAWARDIINMPANECTPKFLLARARQIAQQNKLRLQVFDRRALQRMGAGALLGVAQASAEDAYILKLTYQPPRGVKSKGVISLVGKGITFDSGGLSIKTADGMETMKDDMSGAAAVLATMSVLSQLKPAYEVRGYVPTCENMVSSNAMRPGDVIYAMNGKSIEVLNTDAEGRLILADALTMAVRDRADQIIDLATLTGACIMALGMDYAGLFANDQKLAQRIERAGELAGERYWQLPLAPEYKSQLESSVADLRNSGVRSRGGGAIFGALFLKEFVGDTPWAHLDIAGPAFSDGDKGHIKKGGVGFGVRTLLRLLRD